MSAAHRAHEIAAAFRDRPGAYVHVPFCERFCPFCPYNKVLYEQDRVRRYFAALRSEVEAWVGAFAAPFRSLYLGGGTPSLCLDELGAVLEMLEVEGETAIELLPTHVDPDRVEQLRGLGFTSVSLGVQSFDQAVLTHLGRVNTPADNRRAIENAQGRFSCVDVDLIFDVAFAAPEIFLDDLQTCFASGVDQVSTYPLMRFDYTPFGKVKHQPEREHALLRRATALADAHGYERTSVWTFNKVGAERYTSITREFYLGFGAGAASYTGRAFWANHFSPDRYRERLERDELPIARTVELPGPLAAAYWLFWQAYAGRVDVDRFRALFDGLFPIEPLGAVGVRAGLLSRECKIYALTDRGLDAYHDLERWVTYHYIEPLWAELMQEHRGDPAAPHPPPSTRSPWSASLGRALRRLSPLLPG